MSGQKAPTRFLRDAENGACAGSAVADTAKNQQKQPADLLNAMSVMSKFRCVFLTFLVPNSPLCPNYTEN